jgi:serpin B
MRERSVAVWMPRFKTTSSFNLNEVLKSMGMTEAFSMDADFSGMTGNKELYLSAVLHKAYVDVNEEGTEAAAATAAVMTLKGRPPEKRVVFRADHPFVFIIRDNSTDSILFMGRVTDPTK